MGISGCVAAWSGGVGLLEKLERCHEAVVLCRIFSATTSSASVSTIVAIMVAASSAGSSGLLWHDLLLA